MDKEDLKKSIKEYYESLKEEGAELRKRYPLDIPNDVCKHAVLKGITIENSFGPSVSDYTYLFETKYEKIHIWTSEKNKESFLVSEVNQIVKDINLWRNIGRIIILANAYTNAFEHVSFDDKIQYKWIYYFDSNLGVKNQQIYDASDTDIAFIRNGIIKKATDISNLASIILLLLEDEKLYTAISMLHSAYCIHWFCLICETSPTPYHDHLADEPEIWDYAESINNLEIAIVQSCRCVESLLGQPPSKKNKTSVLRHKEKWRSLLNLNPDDIFNKTQNSYLDFYYDLFYDLRNPAAHSYGEVNYKLKRAEAVNAQCFASIIVRDYIYNNQIDHEEAIEKLNFNTELLERVSENMSTPITMEGAND